MTTRLTVTALLLFGTWVLGGENRQESQEKLNASLRQLEKEIAAARGLEFKKPVEARIIPREAEDGKEKQGYYDPKAKMLFVYDDIADNYKKGTLIHEMVHAIQDQHFDLTKLKATLHKEKFGNDAEMALAALIEGDATYTMIEVLKKEQPKVAGMLDAPLEKSKNLQNAFVYGQGARYVKALKEKGGWASVNMAYRFPPRSTGPILNLANIGTIDLGRGDAKGPYTLLQALLANPKTREDAVTLAKGWRGDRVITGDDGKVHVCACKDAEHAKKLGEALLLVHTAKGEWKANTRDKSWQNDKGHMLAITAEGPRLYILEADDAKKLAKLRERFFGPPTLQIIDGKTKEAISFGVMIERLLAADIVCIGEYHDSEPHHRLQLQIIKALYAHDERLGVGMEMFARPYQKALDRYSAGETKEEEFLKESEYQTRWGFDWSLYRPIIEFCRRNSLPMAALNARKELTRRINQVGLDKLTDEEKKEVGTIDINVKEHRDYWHERLSKMHGPTTKESTPEEKERGYQAMTTWDDYMARSAANFMVERKLRRLVVLAGSGHIDRGFGIPQRAARYANANALTVGIVVEGSGQEKGEVVTDFVVMVK